MKDHEIEVFSGVIERKLTKFTGILAVIFGAVQCILLLLSHFVIDYYVGIGLKEWGSAFGFSILLLISGILLLKNQEYGKDWLKWYFWGCLGDRILVFLLYSDYVHVLTILFPFFFALPFGIILYFPRYSQYFKGNLTLRKKLLLSILVVVTIFLPKLIF